MAQPPQQPDAAQPAADRQQIFEEIALERLRAGSDTSKPVSFLPLPVRLTAITAISITGFGVLWSLVARVPVQVNGLASITPQVQVSSAVARVDGEVAYQVSGLGPNRLSATQQNENNQLSQYWRESWDEAIPAYSRLNALAVAALDNELGQDLVMPESFDDSKAIDNLARSAEVYQKLHFPAATVIARIDNADAQQALDAVRVTTQPKLQNEQLLAEDRRQRAHGYQSVADLLATQQQRQQQELDERVALLRRLEALWRQGFVSTAQLLQEQSVVNGLRNQLLQLDREILNTRFSRSDQLHQVKQTVLNSLEASSALQSALVSYINTVFTIAPDEGLYIVTRSMRNGMQVRAGDELLTYSIDKPVLPEIVPVFVDAATSQQLAKGMSVLVTPKGISRAQYGGIPGVVYEVGKLPLPSEGVAAFAGGRTLAGTIQQAIATPYLVQVKLQQAEPAYCQQMLSSRCYQWSSNRRPPFPVRLGTLADVQVTVQYRHPIDFVMPALRQALGLVVENR